ncbi:hypothetical protein ONZ51_g12858 [Trametes cubensis]|uniref:Uncharacterized protein n=1 Tax=Trametes cubensis TaxID=1111947 RepID=A0AAD7X4A5_9APHY|nr:hypothetical protein ONZ51_g12858 [Trametes cubensis]
MMAQSYLDGKVFQRLKLEEQTSIPPPRLSPALQHKQLQKMHPYNTRANKHRVVRELIEKKALPDADRVTVSLSATGEGHHLRWHWTEESLGGEEDDGSEAGSAFTDSDSSSDSSSSSSRLTDGDGDSEMGDDDRLRTPHRDIPYNPGSVILTPRKGHGLKREPRIGGGFDFWHEQDGVEERLTFTRQKVTLAPSKGNLLLHPDTQYIVDAIRNERNRLQERADGFPLPDSAAPEMDCDDDDAVSVTSEATVIVDPRATPEPTLFNGAMPIIRQPTLPADYNPGVAVPGPLPNRLSTIQEDVEAQPPLAPSPSGADWDAIPPRCQQPDLPPKIDQGASSAAPRRQGRSSNAAPLQRTDTEPIIAPSPAKRK